ncbi:MAG: hydrogenase 3 maturation endopeptidase HyCI [Candidatus Aminicenantes bacterium]|nr:hydrogenase 3 maturation endopeptidase HyCI [Candidatus Aminicenantes bacterium]
MSAIIEGLAFRCQCPARLIGVIISTVIVAQANKKPFTPGRASWRETVRREIEAEGRLVILGVGNEERGDDAAGVLCLRRLSKLLGRGKKRDLLLLEGGVAPENTTGKIRAFSPNRVLILDAVLGGRRPGTIFAFDPGRIAEEDLTTHRLPLTLLIRYLEESIGCRVTCLGIQPRSLEAGRAMSPAVNQAAWRLARFCAGLIGRDISRRKPSRPAPRRTSGAEKRSP